ncbi:fibronectin type III domain-containing protein [Dactylosporangium cerinum]|uniref:Fibronectin type III domain-containing protein n=1 Tax=Dactylosporangium cerinum TaxID=1434730 RepID=A0ABV9W0L5_9ACTN
MTAGSLLVAQQPASAAALSTLTAVSAAGPNSLVVTVTPNPDPPDTVTSYLVSADGPDAGSTADATCSVSGAAAGSCTILGLVSGTTYTVTADPVGIVFTDAIATGVTVPVLTPPTGVTPTATGVSGEINVAWTGAATVLSEIANFTATAYLGGVSTGKTCTSTTNALSNSCKITGLTNGTEYTFKVVANGANSIPNSAASTASAGATPGVGPDAPTDVIASTTAAGVPTVSWSASPTAGVTYTVAAYKEGVAIPGITCPVVAGSMSVVCGGTAVAPGFQYDFKVTAAKDGYSSTPADSGNIYILGTVNPPTDVVVTGGDTEATLTWAAPASGTVTKYRATATTGGGVIRQCITTELTCKVTGLTNATLYTLGVASLNANGTQSTVAASAPTTVTPAVIPKPAPPVVTPPAADDVTSTSATIAWTAAAPVGGAAVVYYVATATPTAPAAASAGTLSCTAVAPAVTCAINGLAPGTAYDVTVVAYASPTAYSTAAATSITTDGAAPGTAGALHGPIVTNHDGLAQMFARGGDNNLYTSVQAANGTWGAWTNLSGLIFSDPTAVLNANGRITVFAIGGDHSIWYRLQNGDGSFAWWTRLGAEKYAMDIEVAQNADGTVAVFIRGQDSNLYSQVQTDPADPSQWSGWTNLSGLIYSNPTAFTRADGVMEVFAVGGDGAVWHRVQSAPNSGTWGWWAHVA